MDIVDYHCSSVTELYVPSWETEKGNQHIPVIMVGTESEFQHNALVSRVGAHSARGEMCSDIAYDWDEDGSSDCLPDLSTDRMRDIFEPIALAWDNVIDGDYISRLMEEKGLGEEKIFALETDRSVGWGYELITGYTSLQQYADLIEAMWAAVDSEHEVDDGCGLHVNIGRKLIEYSPNGDSRTFDIPYDVIVSFVDFFNTPDNIEELRGKLFYRGRTAYCNQAVQINPVGMDLAKEETYSSQRYQTFIRETYNTIRDVGKYTPVRVGRDRLELRLPKSAVDQTHHMAVVEFSVAVLRRLLEFPTLKLTYDQMITWLKRPRVLDAYGFEQTYLRKYLAL